MIKTVQIGSLFYCVADDGSDKLTVLGGGFATREHCYSAMKTWENREYVDELFLHPEHGVLPSNRDGEDD